MSDDDVGGADIRAPQEVRQTQRMWETDLTEPSRRLTRDDLVALEAMHQCRVLQEMSRSISALLDHTRSLEGKVDRLEQYLQAIDPRYPRSERPELGLALAGGPER
jgi:hypothetical protein